MYVPLYCISRIRYSDGTLSPNLSLTYSPFEIKHGFGRVLSEYRYSSPGMAALPGYTERSHKWVNCEESWLNNQHLEFLVAPSLVDHIKSNLFRNLRRLDAER